METKAIPRKKLNARDRWILTVIIGLHIFFATIYLFHLTVLGAGDLFPR